MAGRARSVPIRRSPGGASTPATETGWPTPAQVGVGALTNFFDTLGIGSFATTTALFRALRMVPDRVIPGTLNAGHTLPTVVQAFIYTSIIPVDVLTLIAMITAAVLGAWLGAGVVAKWPKCKVQIGHGPGAHRRRAADGRKLGLAPTGWRSRSVCAGSRSSSPWLAISCSAR